MIVESSRRTSAIPVGAEWNACWNRRRACSRARTRSSRSVTSRSRTIAPPASCLARPVDRLASTTVTAPSPRVQASVIDIGAAGARPAARRARRRARCRVPPRRAQRAGIDRRGRRRARPVSSAALVLAPRTTPVVVDRQHRLGQVVEQQAQLGLGVDEAVDRAVEVAGDPPRLEPRDDDGAQRQHRRRRRAR